MVFRFFPTVLQLQSRWKSNNRVNYERRSNQGHKRLVRAQEVEQVQWRPATVTSPHLALPVPVIVAKDIPYLPDGNRFQNLSLYLPETQEMSGLIGKPASSLPNKNPRSLLPRCLAYLHGGAWRDPQLTSRSIEPTVAHAFSLIEESSSIIAIASINYRVSPFPTHPTFPYDAIKDNHTDPAREAIHPQHLSDVLHAFALLRSFGLTDQSYILSGHSCGACLAFQASLQLSRYYGLNNVPDVPCPAAVLGLNGLYDLPALVHGLGTSHAHLKDEYEMLLSNAFGADKSKWPAASPARFDPTEITEQVREGKSPRLVVLDQSSEDQLVPLNQKERLEATLGKVEGMRVVAGQRCTGTHAAPWEQGVMIWDSLRDVLRMLQE